MAIGWYFRVEKRREENTGKIQPYYAWRDRSAAKLNSKSASSTALTLPPVANRSSLCHS